jgi:hypothetical protein
MTRKSSQLIIEFKAEFVPMPTEHVEAWRVGVSLLLQILMRGNLVGTAQAQSMKVHWVRPCHG